jgi:taurine dioxygenase
MRADRMEIKKAAGALGVEVRGIDLSRMADSPDATRQVRELVTRHGVAFFRAQTLDPDQYAASARRLGDILPHEAYDTTGRDGVVQILESTATKPSRIEVWHSDMTFSATPPSFTLLYADVLPDWGGDTLWASTSAAFSALSEPMRKFLLPLRAVHDFRHGFRESLGEPGGAQRLAPAISANPPVSHPVVRTHPETGALSVFVNPLFTTAVEGLTRDESAALLALLHAHVITPEFTVRLQWQPGTVAIWDNRVTQHKPVNDYFPQHRRMLRITIRGDVPV